MKSLRLKAGAALAAALLAAGAGAAKAGIVDISATSTTGTVVNFAPGDYLIQWIGIADGGAYNGWNGACASGNCSSGWTESFTSVNPANPGFFDALTLPGNATFSSALLALAAYKTAPTLLDTTFHAVPGAPPVVDNTTNISQPWIVHVGQTAQVTLRAGDGSPLDNFGGVSLRITAVPEPLTWSLMIFGFGLMGQSLRSRKRAAHA